VKIGLDGKKNIGLGEVGGENPIQSYTPKKPPSKGERVNHGATSGKITPQRRKRKEKPFCEKGGFEGEDGKNRSEVDDRQGKKYQKEKKEVLKGKK